MHLDMFVLPPAALALVPAVLAGIFGLVAWAVSATTGILFLTPETKRLTSAMTARGPHDPEVQMRLRRILLVLRVDVAVMLLIVFDMVVKPFS